jgi:DNA-binding winged helix-turn-helix (wHTH) protein
MDQQCFLEFGAFRLDTSRRLLYRNRDVVHLAPKAVEILALLVERPKEVLSKQELIEAVWPDTYVEESNLAHNIALLRKTLEDGGGRRSWIETIPKRGYRFAGEVKHPLLAPEHIPQAAMCAQQPCELISADVPRIGHLNASPGWYRLPAEVSQCTARNSILHEVASSAADGKPLRRPEAGVFE